MHRYAIALGSNRRHGRHGAPVRGLVAALEALDAHGITVEAASPILTTAAVGPGGRAFANAAAIVATPLMPDMLLRVLKATERAFGRRRGRRWGDRVLDLDILLWSRGAWKSAGLVVPHRAMAGRRFVLDPLVTIAPGWRLPVGLAVRHLHARLTRPRPSHRGGCRSGP